MDKKELTILRATGTKPSETTQRGRRVSRVGPQLYMASCHLSPGEFEGQSHTTPVGRNCRNLLVTDPYPSISARSSSIIRSIAYALLPVGASRTASMVTK
jgi:hypothetical protein